MNPEIEESGYSEYPSDTDMPKILEGKGETERLLPATVSVSTSSNQWQEYGERIAAFLQDLPRYVTQFFSNYKGPLGTVGLILAVVITVKVTLALLDALDDIPLIAPTLELIGLAYTTWFVYRYLLSAASRQELSQDFQNLKEQVFGTGS
ncbi:MAG: CAAD domain-containing protein [Symplocastrum torsivum CPER-KK1]|jgi:hypothetical protein|uniref:CAAD domain-containing protein n=1 Tax=Symplocastrum torsivum CPER-KK1 TaxID=450513 RepID=A0A951U834_9CYAN|nr:CAAD domain-containing protein [Microcoleus sp. FACHB-SPT15]MBD1809949.1 CAAD domain-containing protein [Microcoleus sp. FACHB-SPT15]MBW4543838.1 CAAD domain-containing protein [Symplocastrum torsivum CPER-KK1]